MAFKKIFWIWLLITVVSGALFKLVGVVIKGHPLWHWAVPILYIGVLILFALYVLTKPQQK